MVEQTFASGGLPACVKSSSNYVFEDVRRAREFYRYLQPENLVQPSARRRGSTFDGLHDHVPSLSHALTPYCQLAAMRCNVAKAMLNVMDRDVMYFLAEASMKREVDQNGGELLEFTADPILMSCSSVPLSGRICELTLRMDRPENPSSVPTFVIPDLTQSQFANMPIIAGPPYYRFYAGVPITTRGGLNIGSIAVMDTKVRPDGLTESEEAFLGTTAQQIMLYLETNRQAIEGRRSRQMASGLEAFMAGKRSIFEEGALRPTERTLKRRAKAVHGMELTSDHTSVLEREPSPQSPGAYRVDGRSDSTGSFESDLGSSNSSQSADADDAETQREEGDSRSHTKTLARATNLLRESLGDLGEDGSVCIVGLATRLGGNARIPQSTNGSAANLPRTSSNHECKSTGIGQTLSTKRLQGRILAISTASNPLVKDTELSNYTIELEDDILRELMRRYPGGNLWTLDESPSSSSEEDAATYTARRLSSMQINGSGVRKRSKRRKGEAMALRNAFPQARQVLYAPVWDAAIGSFAYGCFVTTSLETLSLSLTTDLPFLNSFVSTMMAECSRLDAMAADKQKSDFVGTISHEMRSPLHGVLASVEFLAETDVTGFQRNLIETIDSCGRTLLDTINHVLDFSKVNSFQKQWQASNKKGSHGTKRNHYLSPDNSSRAVIHGAPPLLQLFGVTDISTVLEEVVDGLVLGHTYNSGIDITDMSREARGRGNGQDDAALLSTRSDAVEVILDVQQGDWTFMTQPGAVRRIIMNVTGNAIKYTSRGTIKVQLQQKASSEEDSKIMLFTVTDTGKGISQEFLESRMFVPFAQENALAPGTGLGMSIVRSIVLMLGGTIEVSSQVGKGTTVQVALPMKRPLPGQASSQNTPHSGGTGSSGNSCGDESILLLHNQAVGECIAFYRSQQNVNDPLSRAVQHYVRQWYDLEYVDQELLASASVVIVEEEDLPQLLATATGTPGKGPVLIVMCSVSSKHSTNLLATLEDRLQRPVECIARPCGPNKLARSLRKVLEKKRSIKPRFPQVANLGVIPEAFTPEYSTPVSTAPCDAAGNQLQEMDLSALGDIGPVVQATETFAVSQSSQHAQMAVRDPSAGLRTPRSQMTDRDAFPFPTQTDEKPGTTRSRARSNSSYSKADTNLVTITEKPIDPEPLLNLLDLSTVTIDPYILLVDDNKINLKLLETFLRKKRKYTRLEKAEDGQLAVNAVKCAKHPFDIIFMDISMPVMNGFEATRAIREHESKIGAKEGAMVIALTGLASGRDQSEGFDSGCDIYMTKPVSFKEMGRLLDNWEGHHKINAAPPVKGATTTLDLKLVPKARVNAVSETDV